jgi:hypothetical protein
MTVSGLVKLAMLGFLMPLNPSAMAKCSQNVGSLMHRQPNCVLERRTS